MSNRVEGVLGDPLSGNGNVVRDEMCDLDDSTRLSGLNVRSYPNQVKPINEV